MTGQGLFQITLCLITLTFLAVLLGRYVSNIFSTQKRLVGEKLIYRILRIDPKKEMNWKEYAFAVLFFSFAGFIVLYAILRLQTVLPFNPAGMGEVSGHLAFDTAVSFITNTNWQSYGGESTLSYLSQFLGLTVQNFLSAATGLAVLIALIRGFTRKKTKTIGNFWVDMTRSTIYVLLPLSLLYSVLLGSQGVVQTFGEYVKVPLVESIQLEEKKDDKGNIIQKAETITEQTIAVGPAASQIAIKQLGTNGGGFFNVNSAHPLENPTPFSNFLEVLAILLIPASLCFTFGIMVGDRKQGWAIYAAMMLIFIPMLLWNYSIEQGGNPLLTKLGVEGGNMEGKETRFGIVNSSIWAIATTAASNGSVNSMHASYMPLAGMGTMIMMQLAEVVFGGVGSGLYGMLIFVIVAVFVSGLMVGRTPEYLGKKISSFEMKMASLGILVPPLCVLLGTAIAVMTDAGKAGIMNPSAHGFSEVLYAFSSAGNNNGSAFAGLTANSTFYNTVLGLAMLASRFWIIIPVLAIAGSFAAKNIQPASPGTLPTHTPMFVIILVGTVIMVGLLTFIPALALGPIVEHLNLKSML